MPTYWTLATGGHEKRLSDWGICSDWTIERDSTGNGSVKLRTSEDFDPGASQWAFKASAIIYRDRTSPNGAADSFDNPSGSVVFRGYFDDPERKLSGGRQNITYTLRNVYWLFQRNPFAQYRNQFAGWDASHTRVSAVSIHSPGNGGYLAGDVVNAAGGAGTAATVNIVAVDGAGNPTVISLANGGGSYTANPASPNAVTGGHGTGLQLDLAFGQAPLLTKLLTSEIYLGEQLNSAAGYVQPWPNGNGDQIGEIIDWMNETYNPTRRGAVGGIDPTQDVVTKGIIDPHTKMPITRINTVFCDEAIRSCLRWDVDAVVVEDPSTVIPTIHVRKFAKWNYGVTPPAFIDYTNLPEVAIDITAQQERDLLMQSQLARVLAGVIIYYKSVNVVDNSSWPSIVVDKFPAGIGDFTPEISRHTVELLGERLTTVQVLTTPIAPALSNLAALRAAWWTDHDKSLQEQNVVAASIAASVATVVDDNGAPIDTTLYPYELLSPLPAAVGARVIRATVTATLSFTRNQSAQHPVKDVIHTNRAHTKRIQLTSAPSNTYTSHYESAELVPSGIAASVYRSLAAQQYSGEITFIADQLPTFPITGGGTWGGLTLGVRLKLTGPTTVFTNLLVQSVEAEPEFGKLTISYGPCPAIDFDAWLELARASSARITYDMPSGRGDGSASGVADSSSTSPTDDTSHGVGGKSYHAVIGSPI